MNLPNFERVARLYHNRMVRLFSGRLWEMIGHPELAHDPEFQREVWKVAGGMVQQVAATNAKSWRAAAQKSMRGRQIYEALKAEIERTGIGPALEQIAARNAQLITSLPVEIGARITARATELHQSGARAVEVEREIRRMAPELAKSRLKLIARTEIGRAETDLTAARSVRMGIDWAQWNTSEDSRVRPSHENLDGVLMAWNDPPQPEALIGEKSKLGHGFAGQFPNCRCVMLPLVTLDEVKWPAKVYRAGRIVRMKRAEFARTVGMPIAA